MKAVIAVPTYGPVDPHCSRDVRAATMHAAQNGVVWVGDISPDRLPFGAARNHVAHTALYMPTQPDGVVWVDSDIRMPASAITQLVLTAEHYKIDFLTGIYHQRNPPHLPVLYAYKDGKFSPAVDYVPNVIAPIGGSGFGFVYTSTALLRAIAGHPDFSRDSGWFPDKRDTGGKGEDLSFCEFVHKAGFQPYVDTGNQVGHCGDPFVVWEQTFRETIAKTEIKQIKNNWGEDREETEGEESTSSPGVPVMAPPRPGLTHDTDAPSENCQP